MKAIRIIDIIMSILFIFLVFQIDVIFSYDFLDFIEIILYVYIPISLCAQSAYGLFKKKSKNK